MRRIAELSGLELKWEQPNTFKMEYCLFAGDEMAATLKFRSSFGSFAIAESADGCWTFKRVGFFQTRATIRECDSETEIASYRNNTWTNGGTLEFPDGRQYRASTNFWMTQFDFFNEAEVVLFSYRKIGGIIHLSSYVDLFSNAIIIPELPWMIMLGWYLTIMMHQDAAAAVAA